MTISHTLKMTSVPEKWLPTLKRICQSIMNLGQGYYAFVHSTAQAKSCPYCEEHKP